MYNNIKVKHRVNRIRVRPKISKRDERWWWFSIIEIVLGERERWKERWCNVMYPPTKGVGAKRTHNIGESHSVSAYTLYNFFFHFWCLLFWVLLHWVDSPTNLYPTRYSMMLFMPTPQSTYTTHYKVKLKLKTKVKPFPFFFPSSFISFHIISYSYSFSLHTKLLFKKSLKVTQFRK